MLFEEASKENGFRSPSSTLLPPGISPVTPEPKSKSQVPVDSAANVSGMLSVEAPVENAMESSSPKNWARFESAGPNSSLEDKSLKSITKENCTNASSLGKDSWECF
ncbi:hypothetical protein AAC387_Pa11g1587 [Persea americana]